METGELVSVLKDAGLSPYQANAYVTLLELGAASASELATASGVPGPRIYDVLRDLEDGGYIVTYEQDQLYARATDPADALATIRTRIGRFETAVEEIESRWHQPEAHDHEITIVRRFETVFEQTKRDIRNAEDYVLMSITPNQFRELRPVLREAHERGVYTHVVIQPQPDEEFSIETEEFEGVCAEAQRTVPCWGKPFAVLIDHRKVGFALYIGSPDEYGILVDDPLHEFVFWFYLAGLSEIAESVYTNSRTQLPIAFGEIRGCIRMVEPLLRDDATVIARVDGRWTRTKRSCELSGRLTDIQYAGQPATDGPASLFHLIEQATFVIEADQERYTIGGHGASLEDVEADRIVVEDIEYSD
ncbi:TrmB family transcriptional regulator [Haladaptatus salinisoli]|uniref:TrmB family transcriptional regulator n=1 Tax=Haladaptatus salinisoli TaxID=2884876 RepID=UPI001D0B96C3|nr:TrmB family transcriptional regulator [Haladaptatus salinisoli]